MCVRVHRCLGHHEAAHLVALAAVLLPYLAAALGVGVVAEAATAQGTDRCSAKLVAEALEALAVAMVEIATT